MPCMIMKEVFYRGLFVDTCLTGVSPTAAQERSPTIFTLLLGIVFGGGANGQHGAIQCGCYMLDLLLVKVNNTVTFLLSI